MERKSRIRGTRSRRVGKREVMTRLRMRKALKERVIALIDRVGLKGKSSAKSTFTDGFKYSCKDLLN